LRADNVQNASPHVWLIGLTMQQRSGLRYRSTGSDLHSGDRAHWLFMLKSQSEFALFMLRAASYVLSGQLDFMDTQLSGNWAA